MSLDLVSVLRWKLAKRPWKNGSLERCHCGIVDDGNWGNEFEFECPSKVSSDLDTGCVMRQVCRPSNQQPVDGWHLGWPGSMPSTVKSQLTGQRRGFLLPLKLYIVQVMKKQGCLASIDQRSISLSAAKWKRVECTNVDRLTIEVLILKHPDRERERHTFSHPQVQFQLLYIWPHIGINDKFSCKKLLNQLESG